MTYLSKIMIATLMMTMAATAKVSEESHESKECKEKKSIHALKGFGVGASIIYTFTSSKVFRTYTVGGDRQDLLTLTGKGIVGGGTVLYTIVGDRFCTSFEGIASWGDVSGQSTDSHVVGNASQVTLKMKNTFGLAMRFGTLIGSVIPYIKAGYVKSKWSLVSQLNVPGNPTAGTSTHKAGYLLGAGLETPLNEKLTIGGEFFYARYKKIAMDHTDALGNSLVTYRTKPAQNTIQLTLKYKG